MSKKQKIVIETQDHPQAAVIWLHGLGASGEDFVPIIPLLQLEDLAIRFIFPDAPVQKVTINGGMKMPAWYDILGLERHSQQDEAGIRASETLIQELIAEQIDLGIPSSRIVIAGFSQGGAIALQTGLRYPQPLAGIMALSTYLPLADLLSDEIHSANRQIPIFIAHGDHDNILPLHFAEITQQQLSTLDYPVEYHVYEMDHSVCMEETIDIGLWLRKLFDSH